MKGGIRKRPVVIITYMIITMVIILSLISLYNQLDFRSYRMQCNQVDPDESSSSMVAPEVEYSERRSANFLDENQTLQIAIVCGGFNSTRGLYVLIKSILFHRSNPIQLHLFVDNISHVILNKLFDTWNVRDLAIKYYNITQYEPEVSWITSHHYSHLFGLMKLVVPSVLAEINTLSRLIMLDTDILVLGDIADAWQEFTLSLTQTGPEDSVPIFGLVENQSDWYLTDNQLSRGRPAWPAMGRGFNTGIILIDMLELRKIDWRRMWRQVTETELISYLSTSLADQDIYNAVMRSNSRLVYRLSNCFNMQLNDNTNLTSTCTKTKGLRVIHWNSPYKLDTKNEQAEHFRAWYYAFTNLDGSLLRSNLRNQRPEDDNNLEPPNIALACKDIRPRPSDILTTYLYFKEFRYEPQEWDVTLVVHLSFDRMQSLNQVMANWQGPISVAIYLLEAETQSLNEFISSSDHLQRRKNIGIHLIFKNHGFNYPINRLRNLALDNAISPYVYLSDIDFVPSPNMYSYLKRMIADMASKNDSSPLQATALVIPAFENAQYKTDFPPNKVELLKQLNLGSMSIFRDRIWPKGQAPTDYARWKLSTTPYRVNWTLDYEPFIVTDKNIPRFDERFVGFGWNKVEHIMQLAALGYKFIVVPEAFIIHRFHSASYDITKHRDSYEYRSCVKELRKTFLAEMKLKGIQLLAPSDAG